MIFKDKLYQLESFSRHESELKANIVLNEMDDVFKGHFPKNPILPGVAQLEIIKEILSVEFNRPVELKQLVNCKYLKIINPIESKQIEVRMILHELENELKVQVIFESSIGILTKCSAIYR